MFGSKVLANWHYHLPDMLLVALLGLLIVRLTLLLTLGLDRGGRPMSVLRVVTDPIVGTVGAVTPRLLPPALVIICAMAWLLAARVALFVAVSATGVRLSMG